ncbi:MAG TPA: pantoate--beta-alanine ligase [Ktedonobacterales bacterium]|jgi:pantoate--beta-alanine ligase
MRVIATVAEMVAERCRLEERAVVVGLVPTMGYLHAGHVSLVNQARTENDLVAASIFVNPTQFGPGEDLSRYPRDLARDLAQLEAAGADVIFTPEADDMYPPGFSTYVVPSGPLAERLEAASRPVHFRGVATVVAKLFNIIRPAHAYFGQKDAQQVAVLRRLVADLNMPLELRAGPTVREADGLAMSSRNAYLAGEDRAAATVLRHALEAGRARWEATSGGAGPGRRASTGRPYAVEAGAGELEAGVGEVEAVLAAMRAVVAAEPRATLDYADVCDPDTFAPLAELRTPALLAIAARVGPARLIDNYLLRADGTWEVGAAPLT